MYGYIAFSLLIGVVGYCGFALGSGRFTQQPLPAIRKPNDSESINQLSTNLAHQLESPRSPHTHQPGLTLQPRQDDQSISQSITTTVEDETNEPASPASILLQTATKSSVKSINQSNEKRRVIIVAKHLPIRITAPTTNQSNINDWKVDWEDSRSFLSNLRALDPSITPQVDQSADKTNDKINPSYEVHWVGLAHANMINQPAAIQSVYRQICERNHCTPVFLDQPVDQSVNQSADQSSNKSTYQSLHDQYLNGFCKRILWPMLHYVMPDPINQLIDQPIEPSSNDKSVNHSATQLSDWSAYVKANDLIGQSVLGCIKSENDSVWIHNYHLLMVPSIIRSIKMKCKMGLFIHTPFPSSDVFRSLPARATLLESMMACDLIGFHTFDYARHFLSCVKRVLDLDFETLPGGALGIKYSGRFVSILISHVGIASPVIKKISRSQPVIDRMNEIRKMFDGRKILIGIDDLDAVKGPLLKIQAIDRFFEKYAQFRSTVVFVEILLLSKNYTDTLGIQRDLLAEIDRVKAKYGQSVIHVIQPAEYMPVSEQVAWYRASHVAVISTFWDGLNLMPYEYTASQDSNDPGALLISEFMGCSRSLNGVMRVNPWSLETVADAIEGSLSLSQAARKAMHERRYSYVINHTIEQWAHGFLTHLASASQFAAHLNFVVQGGGRVVGLRADFEPIDEKVLLAAYQQCDKRVFFLDYDGTLVPSNQTTNQSINQSNPQPPPSHVLRLLTRLTADPNNCVFLMSGRPRSLLQEWFGSLSELGLAAEKGLFLRWPKRLEQSCRMTWPMDNDSIAEDDDVEEDVNQSPNQSINQFNNHLTPQITPVNPVNDADWEHLVNLSDVSWKSVAYDLIKSYTDQTDGSFIEDKEFGLIWHYELCDEEYGKMQATDLHKYLTKIVANSSVDVVKYDYSRLIEVKPHGVSKGTAVTAICEALFNSRDKEQQMRSHPTFHRAYTAPPVNKAVKQQQPPFRYNPKQSTNQSVFFLACGDDRGDEDMFVAVQEKHYLQEKLRIQRLREQIGVKGNQSSINQSIHVDLGRPRRSVSSMPTVPSTPINPSTKDYIFTVCVGQKPSAAHYYVDDDRGVVHMLAALTAKHRSGSETPKISSNVGKDVAEMRRRKKQGTQSTQL